LTFLQFDKLLIVSYTESHVKGEKVNIMDIFVNIALGQVRSNVARTLLIIYESFVQRPYLSQIVDSFSWGLQRQ